MRSMLSFRIRQNKPREGAALNFYATRTGVFDDRSVATGSLFAACTAMALRVDELQGRVVHLERALQSNRQIGTALGILMARELYTEEHAFDLLREASQRLNRKLADIADEVTVTGLLPHFDRPQH
ncbi:hypothetical protein GCM10011594_16480 [Nakamurella endophytica]|uniref:ANTAR domain-containing protein n=1 Tax=Nakamurella endophytica TaxID=1748367 RepID=A0A917WF19_9ACTN|nr:hypothetical protein GCM10011594_16480 [Nakamurella endophytica]